MTLLELVRTVREQLNDLGGDGGGNVHWEVDDTACLWKNTEIIRYLNLAHKELAARRPYRDSATEDICTLEIRANTARYALDSRILSIENVTVASTGHSLLKTTLRDLRVWATAQFTEPGVDAWKTKTGTPAYYSEDVEPGKITLIPVPIATTDSLYLTVYRLPLEPFDWLDRSGDVVEPAESLVEALLAGAMARAYQKRDNETYDPRSVAQYENQFTQLVGGPVDYQTLENRRWNANLDMSIVPAGYSRKSSRRSWRDDA
jgi:hypothetical protein